MKAAGSRFYFLADSACVDFTGGAGCDLQKGAGRKEAPNKTE
jgi:hypothetical protein